MMNLFIFALFAPVLGGFIYGIERVVKARMQGKMEPPLMQPFYDFAKLMDKRHLMIHSLRALMGIMYFMAEWFSLFVLFLGHDVLIVVFFHVLAVLALVIGGKQCKKPLFGFRSTKGTYAYDKL